MYHAAALLPKEAALVRSFAARLQRNIGHLEHGLHTGGRGRGGRLDAVRQLVRGTARRRGWGSAGLYTLCPASNAQQLLRGEVSEDSLHRQHPSLWLI